MAPKTAVTYTFRPFRSLPYGYLFACDLCCASTDDPDGHAAWHESLTPPRKNGDRYGVTIQKGG